MRRRTIGAAASFTALALLCLFPVPAYPTNGLSIIGFGAESGAMAGADLAVARDTAAMNSNPAGITQIPGNALDSYIGAAYPLKVAHRDQFGNDLEVSNRSAFLGGGGFTHRFGDGPFTAGIGFFAQGGAGNVYKNVTTPFGTTDELSSLFRIAKITPTVAYRCNEKLSLGVSLQVVYTDISQKVFPETSSVDPGDPSHTFFGTDVEMNGYAFGVKLGALYKVSDRVALGAAYTNRIPLPLSGTVVANMSAAGLGKVTYRDASIDGMALPQEVDLGVAVRPVPPLLVAVKVAWLDWSGAIRTSTLHASGPSDSGAQPTLSLTSTMNWKDQYVFAIGVAYDLTKKVILRAGYNYGSNPIPSNTINPLLAAIAEHHVTVGGGYVISPKWQVSTSVEYAFNNSVTYSNPELPFGPGAEEELETINCQVMLSRRW